MAAASYNVLRPILIGLLVIIIEGLDTTYGSDYDDKLKTCKVGNDENCRLGPYCFTFSSTKEDIYAPDNICNTKLGDDNSKCQLPIVSVKKSDDDWFTVVLMGSVPKNQPPSWFAIGFSKSPTIMKVNQILSVIIKMSSIDVLGLIILVYFFYARIRILQSCVFLITENLKYSIWLEIQRTQRE